MPAIWTLRDRSVGIQVFRTLADSRPMFSMINVANDISQFLLDYWMADHLGITASRAQTIMYFQFDLILLYVSVTRWG